MSPQLKISSVFSVLAMAAFALHASAGGADAPAPSIMGAPIEIEAPTMLQLPDAPALLSLAD